MRKVDPHAEGRARILIKESDRDVSSLEKSLTDIYEKSPHEILCKSSPDFLFSLTFLSLWRRNRTNLCHVEDLPFLQSTWRNGEKVCKYKEQEFQTRSPLEA
jgi:hypothetical protein